MGIGALKSKAADACCFTNNKGQCLCMNKTHVLQRQLIEQRSFASYIVNVCCPDEPVSRSAQALQWDLAETKTASKITWRETLRDIALSLATASRVVQTWALTSARCWTGACAAAPRASKVREMPMAPAAVSACPTLDLAAAKHRSAPAKALLVGHFQELVFNLHCSTT